MRKLLIIALILLICLASNVYADSWSDTFDDDSNVSEQESMDIGGGDAELEGFTFSYNFNNGYSTANDDFPPEWSFEDDGGGTTRMRETSGYLEWDVTGTSGITGPWFGKKMFHEFDLSGMIDISVDVRCLYAGEDGEDLYFSRAEVELWEDTTRYASAGIVDGWGSIFDSYNAGAFVAKAEEESWSSGKNSRDDSWYIVRITRDSTNTLKIFEDGVERLFVDDSTRAYDQLSLYGASHASSDYKDDEEAYFRTLRVKARDPTGYLISEKIDPEEFVEWDTFNADQSVTPEGSIIYSVLDGGDVELCPDVQDGDNISSCAGNTDAIKLKAEFTSDDVDYTPTLNSWSISYNIIPNPKPVANITSPTDFMFEDGENITFDASDSYDPGGPGGAPGSIETYEWIIDEGTLDEYIRYNETFQKSDLSLKNHTVKLTVEDDLGTWSDPEYTWVYVRAKLPVAHISSINPTETAYGGKVKLTGCGYSESGTIVGWHFTSSLDGELELQNVEETAGDCEGYAGLIFSGEIYDLAFGEHEITLKVKDEVIEEGDDIGGWSKEDSYFSNVYVGIPALGTPTQVIPRLNSILHAIQTFNAPPVEAGNPIKDHYTCYVDEGDYECDSEDVERVDCPLNGNDVSPGLTFNLPEGSHYFVVGDEMADDPALILTGDIIILDESDEPYGKDEPYEYSSEGEPLMENNFPAGKKIIYIRTSEDIDLDEGGNFLKYNLYKIEECNLTSVDSRDFAYAYPAFKNKFKAEIYRDNLACEGETCTYIGEILAYKGMTSLGGALFTFDYYELGGGNLRVEPSSIDFDVLNQNTRVNRTLTLENIGGETLTNITINSSIDNIEIHQNKTELEGGESTDVILEFTAPEDVTTGNYTANLTINSTSEGFEEINVEVTYAYNRLSGLISVSPASVDFGTLNRGETSNVTVTITNNGEGSLRDLEAFTPTQIYSEFESTTIRSGNSTTLLLSLTVPSLDAEGDHYESVYVSTAGEVNDTIVLPVSYDVEVIPAAEGSVTPDAWNLGTIAGGVNFNKAFAVSVDMNMQEVDVEVTVDGTVASMIVLDKTSFTLTRNNNSEEIIAMLTSSTSEGNYDGSIIFTFSVDDTPLDTANVYVSFAVTEDEVSIIDDARNRYFSLKNQLDSLVAQAGSGTDLANRIESNVSTARILLEDVADAIDDAEESLNAGDTQDATDLLSSASITMDNIEDILSEIQAVLNAGQEEAGMNLLPIGIVLAIAGIFGLLLFALREGWIPAHKAPWLVNIFKKIGLGPIIERPADMTPKSRFAPPGYAAQPRGARPVMGAQAAPRPAPDLRAQWEQYYKKHPEYAKYVKEKYRSYYNRRYK